MRILLAHNYYQQPGGEDAVFAAERAVLERAGHQVTAYIRHNDEVRQYHLGQKLSLIASTTWNSNAARDIQKIIDHNRPEVVHFTNTFPLISPSAYYACRRAQIPVVQTVQNYRLVCPAATLLRNGQICEKCIGKTPPWPSIVHACYHDSHIQSAVVALMLTSHRLLKTWHEHVNIYVAATEFLRQKLIEGGLPAGKVLVKPNFLVVDPGQRNQPGNYALFVGRLAEEKGIRTLLQAWRYLPGVPLKIVGDGPLMPEVVEFARNHNLDNVEFCGRQSNMKVRQLMKGARFLVFPSQWYEGFPVTIVEALACGLPILASKLGGIPEVVKEHTNGLYFSSHDAHEMSEVVEWAWQHDTYMETLGRTARSDYESKYTASRNYELLMDIYLEAQSRLT